MSTQVPWRVKEPPKDCAVRYQIFGERRADGSDYAPLFEVVRRKDAYLAAAAPDMLSELRAVMTFLEDECVPADLPSDPPGSFAAEARRHADSIASTIKKAMGEA